MHINITRHVIRSPSLRLYLPVSPLQRQTDSTPFDACLSVSTCSYNTPGGPSLALFSCIKRFSEFLKAEASDGNIIWSQVFRCHSDTRTLALPGLIFFGRSRPMAHISLHLEYTSVEHRKSWPLAKLPQHASCSFSMPCPSLAHANLDRPVIHCPGNTSLMSRHLSILSVPLSLERFNPSPRTDRYFVEI